MTDFALHAAPPAPPAPTRPLYWSLRRELWENRSLYLAPLLVTGFVLLAVLINTLGLPKKMRTLSSVPPAKQHVTIVKPFSMAPSPILFTTFVVGFFYALHALYGERRDRSILFWKSLPVSDRTTVLSKAAIPLVVLPLIGYVLAAITVFVLLLVSTVWLVVNGLSPARLWAEVRFVQSPVVMLYGLAVHSLWFAPLYAWLLLISAWARRAPFLWAVLPPFVVMVVERIIFSSTHFASWMAWRMGGAMKTAFGVDAYKTLIDRVSQLTPLNFLSTPGLWTGLLFAAACLAAAARLRREREAI